MNKDKQLVYTVNDKFNKLAYIVIHEGHTPTVYKVDKIGFDDYQAFLDEISKEPVPIVDFTTTAGTFVGSPM